MNFRYLMPGIKRKFTAVLFIMLVGLIQITFGQTIHQTQNKADQTLRGNGRVNPSTLGMELSIPLGGYPGRAGNDKPLTLSYSSKIWGTQNPDTWETPLGTTYVNIRPQFGKSSVGGWTNSLGVPYLEFPTDLYYDPLGNSEGQIWAGQPDVPVNYIKRVKVIMPDGSAHEMRQDDTVYTGVQGNSYSEWEGTYLSVDGSKMRLEYSSSEKILYFPDGGRFFFNSPYIYIDRHGNKMTYGPNTRQWTDTLGRVLTDPFITSASDMGTLQPAEGTQIYQFPGFNGQNQQVEFVWAKLSTQQSSLPYMTNMFCSGFQQKNIPAGTPVLFSTPGTETLACDPYTTPFDPVLLTEIHLQNGSKYKFHYNVYAEIDKIEYPTGGYERFEYDQITPLQSAYNQAYDQFNRGVKKRWVSSDGTAASEVLWQYDVTRVNQNLPTDYYKIKTTAPDDTYSEQFLIDADSDIEYPYAFGNIAIGRPYDERSYSATGQLLRRKLTKYDKTGAQTGGYSGATRDLKPIKEISLVFEPNASSALATMSETVYDSNSDAQYFASLNSKQIRQYNFLPIETTVAQDSTIDQIASLFSANQLVKISETDYLYNEGYKAKNLQGLTTEIRMLNPLNTNEVLSKSQLLYDEQNQYFSMAEFGSTVGYEAPTGNNVSLRGNATTQRTWVKDTNTWIETHVQYDNFGNTRKVWDSSGDQTRFVEIEYSPQYYYAYPTKKTTPAPDPSGARGTADTSNVSFTYDFQTGSTLSATDGYGQTTSIEYDALIRPKKVIPPANEAAIEKEYGDTPGNLYLKVRRQIDGQNWAESTSFMDGLGRVYKTQTKDLQGDVFTEIDYENNGRVKRVSSPYRQGEQKLWSKPRYDSAGRIVETYAPAPDGQTGASLGVAEYGISTVSGFVGNYVVGTDASGRKARSITNVFGQVIRMDEPVGNNDLGTMQNPNQPSYYSYSVKGELTRIQQGQQNRYFMYDGLSRLIRIRQPEQTVNPTLETTGNSQNNQWTGGFSYDIFDNLITAVDAKGVTVTNSYDNAGRLLTRSYSDGVTPQVDYYYDGKGLSQAPQYARGNLTKVSNGISENRYTNFDNLGRILSSEQVTNGQTYGFGYKYNLSGDLIEEVYPSGRTIKHSLDADGALSEVSSMLPNSPNKIYASNYDYTAAGNIKAMKLGNGRWETAVYNNYRQLTQIGLGASATDINLWKVNYEYGELNTDGTVDVSKNTGSIAKQIMTLSSSSSAVQTYKYDELNRLIEAKETADSPGGTLNWKQELGYDRYGNRINFNQTTGSQQVATTPAIDTNSNRFAAGQGYVYDFNGNLVQDVQGRTFIYNGDNRQSQVKDASQNVVGSYFYDGNGARIKKVTSSETTVFVYDASGDLAAEYSTVVQSQSPVTSYLTTDHLGSPRIVTDDQGNITSRRDFMPFGEELGIGVGARTAALKYSATGVDNVRQRFTGYEKDAETNLDFAEARMYENRHGRFTGIDPLLSSAELTNPQTFNRYAYTGNNPINYSDPSGLSWCRQSGGSTRFAGENVGCDEGETNIDGTVGVIRSGNWEDLGANVGNVVRFNSNGTVAVLDPSKAEDATQIARVTGAEVQSTFDQALETTATTLNGIVSAFAEDNGFTPLPTAQNSTGRAIGHIIALSQGLGETITGGALIGTGIGGNVVGGAFDLTGAGVIVGVPVHAVSTGAIVGGGILAGHGIFVTSNTILNVFSQSSNSPTIGELRKAGIKDAHHPIQDAAVRDIPGYNTNAAPGVGLGGPSNVRGTPHNIATKIQRQKGGGTYGAERRIGYKALRKAGLTKNEARAVIKRADGYFSRLGVTKSTPTRIPGNRRR